MLKFISNKINLEYSDKNEENELKENKKNSEFSIEEFRRVVDSLDQKKEINRKLFEEIFDLK